MLPKHLERAIDEIGVAEQLGPNKNNPRILDYLSFVLPGQNTNDEIPWCSAFMNWSFAGRGTGKPDARSWLSWGKKIELDNAKPGDIVVFWRDNAESWKGHVGQYMGRTPSGDIMVLGGNQGNMVCIAPYSVSKLLGIRRLDDI